MTTATAPIPAAALRRSHKPMPFEQRVARFPRAGDTFTATRYNITHCFEVLYVKDGHVYYKKWEPNRTCPQIRYTTPVLRWRHHIGQAQIGALP